MNTAARSVQGTAARPPSPSAAPWQSVSTRSQLRCRYQPAARQDLDTDRGRHCSFKTSETLRKKVRQAEADQGLRSDLPSSAEREQIRELKREVAELHRANEMLRAASLFFAIELDESRPK